MYSVKDYIDRLSKVLREEQSSLVTTLLSGLEQNQYHSVVGAHMAVSRILHLLQPLHMQMARELGDDDGSEQG